MHLGKNLSIFILPAPFLPRGTLTEPPHPAFRSQSRLLPGLFDEQAVFCLRDEIKQDVERIGDELFIEGGENPRAAVDVFFPRAVRLRDSLHRKGRAVPIGGTPEQIIAGDGIIVGDPDYEIQPALPDPLFIVG